MDEAFDTTVFPPELRDDHHSHFAQFLQELAVSDREELKKISHSKTVTAGEVLLEENENLSRIGYVLSGTLCMKKVLLDGRAHIIGLLIPTDMFGRIFDATSNYRIEALTDAVIFYFDRQPLEQILRRSPKAERIFLVSILDELDAARERVRLLGAHKVIKRAAAYLLSLCRRKSKTVSIRYAPVSEPIQVHLPIKHTDLALYLGTRPETLSRAFHDLEKRGILKISNRYSFDVLNLAALAALADQGDPPDSP